MITNIYIDMDITVQNYTNVYVHVHPNSNWQSHKNLKSQERPTSIQNYGDISSFKVYPLVDLAKKPIFTRKHSLA